LAIISYFIGDYWGYSIAGYWWLAILLMIIRGYSINVHW
jgi:hypothetical protein